MENNFGDLVLINNKKFKFPYKAVRIHGTVDLEACNDKLLAKE